MYRDFRNLPRFLGDVVAVRPLDSGLSRWTIQGPLGIRVHWTIKVTEMEENTRIFYETTGFSLGRSQWQMYFSPIEGGRETEVREAMLAPLTVSQEKWQKFKKNGNFLPLI